jgi:phosphopantetheine adenylyltransferase
MEHGLDLVREPRMQTVRAHVRARAAEGESVEEIDCWLDQTGLTRLERDIGHIVAVWEVRNREGAVERYREQVGDLGS